MGELVQLYVYDITYEWSNSSSTSGYSSGVFGFSFVYHTSIIAFGKEYSFGCRKGVEVTTVDREKDIPDQVYVLGRTKKTESELKNFVEDLKSKFNKRKYDLLQLNCQIFCSKLCQFLGVEGLPNRIMTILQRAKDIFGPAGVGCIAYKSMSKNHSSS